MSQSQRALLALECELETIHAVLSGDLVRGLEQLSHDQFTVLYTETLYWTVVRGGSERQRERGTQDGSGREKETQDGSGREGETQDGSGREGETQDGSGREGETQDGSGRRERHKMVQGGREREGY